MIAGPGRQNLAMPLAVTVLGNMHLKTRQISFIKLLLLLLLLLLLTTLVPKCSSCA